MSSLPLPKASVIIPNFNYAAFVGSAIASVKAQTLNNLECIVVDDGSTDDSVAVIKDAIRNDKRFRLIQQPNMGVAHARNAGIRLARGEFICCLDADDAIDPTFLSTVVPALEENRTLGIVYTGIELMDSKNRLRGQPHAWPHQYASEKGLLGNQIPTCCLFRKDYWTRLGGYRQRYAPHGAGQEDADFWFRVLASGGSAKKVTEKGLFYHRIHHEQTTKRHRQDWVKNEYFHWHPFVTDDQHPLASQLGVPQFGSWPVRSYDCPLISVIVPIGPGHESIVLDALDSVEAQTFREWELIVVNDSGAEIDFTPWPYARVVNTNGGKGAGFARNRGAEIARANLLTFLDADDFLQPEFLHRIYEIWQQTGHWVYTDMYTERSTGETEIYHCEDWSLRKLWRSGLAAVTCLYTKEMWESVGGFDEALLGREDWDFHLRLAKAGFCGMLIDEPLFTYRHTTGQRRRIGLKHQEAKVLRDRYNLEELMANCTGCGGQSNPRRRSRSETMAKSPNWQSKADLGWPLLEYVGKNPSELIFKGRATRRVYRAGNNKFHKFIRVHPDDLNQLLGLTCFRLKVESEPQQIKAPKPQPPPVIEPVEPVKATEPPVEPTKSVESIELTEPSVKIEPVEIEPEPNKGNGELDIGSLSVRVLRTMDLTGQDIGALMQDEREGRNRRTIMAHLRLEQRKRVATSELGQGA